MVLGLVTEDGLDWGPVVTVGAQAVSVMTWSVFGWVEVVGVAVAVGGVAVAAGGLAVGLTVAAVPAVAVAGWAGVG